MGLDRGAGDVIAGGLGGTAQIAELEQRAIAAALQRSGGNRAAAARLLGISRASLYDKLGAAFASADVSEVQTNV